MGTSKKWVVTARDGKVSASLAHAIAASGFVTETDLDALGVVIGSGDESVAEALRALDGIADVTEDEPIDIGPPGSPDSW